MSQLADTCNQIRKLCQDGDFKRTDHSTIMEYLRMRADRFRRNQRLSGEEMEKIIAKLKRAEEEKGNGDAESNTRVAEHVSIREAITEGLLQPHGTLPNTKQDGIFRLLCKNPNGLKTESRRTTSLVRPSILKMNWRWTDYYIVNTD